MKLPFSISAGSVARSPSRAFHFLQTAAPGLAAVAVVAVIARFAAQWMPWGLSEILLAVWLGLVIASARWMPASSEPGIRFAQQTVLRLGIILLGARLSLVDVATIGLGALGLVVICMTAVFAFVLLVGRVTRLPGRLVLLIGVGTAVCGNSAIIATAPVVKAEEREVSFAVATITLFGTLALFLYPLVGSALQLSDATFGLWSGVAINDTSQVVAASTAYSPIARDVATVVKLVRNTLMAPLILLIAMWWSSAAVSTVEGTRTREGALKAFPIFVLGFLAMALLRTAGVIDAASAQVLHEAAKVCILMALAAVGLGTRIGLLRAVGPKPFVLGLGAGALLAAVSLAAISLLHLDVALH
jgi:uncharacterized integral membrane protein (TIGR00698 family)